ncbi:Autophagy-related protein 27 like protein [Aduncisulcus paluster]|uniref:Autophagy-related protein 27 like protein n=1 Tax=Aduncisulcus paluster TaxID=2918883 RepID=A0ABQ5KWX9_9EUKA|nr:Autophagy-related protein 27 like protein [Aduncisulcus paluster]
MNFSLKQFLLVFFAIIVLTYAKKKAICHDHVIEIQGYGFDIDKLTNNEEDYSYMIGTDTIFVNFLRNFPTDSNEAPDAYYNNECASTASCVRSSATIGVMSFLNYGQEITLDQMSINGTPISGMQLTEGFSLRSGVSTHTTTPTKTYSIINVIGTSGDSVTTDGSITTETDGTQYVTFKLYTPNGYPLYTPDTKETVCTPPGWSWGSVFCLVLLCLAGAYIIVGMILGSVYRKGCHYHSEFWSEFPGLVIDGILFIWNKITGCGKSNVEGRYEAI